MPRDTECKEMKASCRGILVTGVMKASCLVERLGCETPWQKNLTSLARMLAYLVAGLESHKGSHKIWVETKFDCNYLPAHTGLRWNKE